MTPSKRAKTFRLQRHRRLQLLVLVLLAVCAAQVSWWLLDQRLYTREVLEASLMVWYRDLGVAEELLDRGATEETIRTTFPHLFVTEEGVEISPQALEELRDRRFHHLRQYTFEGTFFFLVLLSAMAVIWRVLGKEAELHQRQENFLASVSHELKSPIASLRLSTETLAMRELPRTKQSELLDRSLRDLERLEGLVTAILDTNRLEQGTFTVERQRLSLASEVAAVLDQLGYREGRSGVPVEVDVPEDLEVWADPLCVRTVLRNLVDNALKACAHVEGASVSIGARSNGRGVEVKVVDRGRGFAPEEARKLFEKFYRPGDEMRRTSPGTGLGLYIVQRCMELEGGRVHASSEGEGRGAQFSVVWPYREEAA